MLRSFVFIGGETVRFSIPSGKRNFRVMNLTEQLRRLESPTRLEGIDDYTVSVNFLAFIAHDSLLNPATATTLNVYIADFNFTLEVGEVNNGGGASSGPVWSPDGCFLAYLEQRQAGNIKKDHMLSLLFKLRNQDSNWLFWMVIVVKVGVRLSRLKIL